MWRITCPGDCRSFIFIFFSDFGVSGFLIHLGCGGSVSNLKFLSSGFCVELMTGASVLSSMVFTLAQKVEKDVRMRHRSRGRLLMWLDSTPSSRVLWVSGFCENLRPSRDCSQDWILYEVELVLKGARAGSRYKPAWCFQSSIVLRVEQALWINSFWSFHHLYICR